MKRSLATAAVAASVLVSAAPAGAVTKHGITPLSPKAGATLPVGQPATFKARVKGPGKVWFHICKSKKKDRDGQICYEEAIDPGKRGKNRVFSITPQLYTFPEYFLQAPGTYYWQAYRIDCRVGSTDCIQEGPVMRFKVG